MSVGVAVQPPGLVGVAVRPGQAVLVAVAQGPVAEPREQEEGTLAYGLLVKLESLKSA